MSARRPQFVPADHAGSAEAFPPGDGPADAFLIASMLGGDEAALTRIMDRYDRLVRYSVFRAARQRAVQDPQWVDSLASETWVGFVRAMQARPDQVPTSLATYLIQIARYRTISALRGRRIPVESLEEGIEPAPSDGDDPHTEAERAEELAALRDCVAAMSPADHAVYAQLGPISERSWQKAAAALGVAESTLRSRWKKITEDLRRCLAGKPSGKSLARREADSDT